MTRNGPTRAGLRALEHAAMWIGVRETNGPNRSRRIDEWNRAAGAPLGSPYCATFQHFVWKLAGVQLGVGTANADSYCPALLAWGRERGYERVRPFRGYLVLFDWNEDGVVDHVGLVERVVGVRWTRGRFSGFLRTVEANTSAGLAGSQSNGDGVHRRTRRVNSSTRFLRVPGQGEL